MQEGFFEQAVDFAHRGYVRLDGDGAGAEGFDLRHDGLGAGVVFVVVYCYRGAAEAELEGDAGADAAGGAGYEGDFSGEGGEGGLGGGVAVCWGGGGGWVGRAWCG